LAREAIRFWRQGRPVEVSGFHPRTTLLDYLRLEERRVGTKEGCAEGDCGACTVAVGRERDGRVHYEPVNACILLLGQVDGAEVVTVEDLASKGYRPIVDAALQACGEPPNDAFAQAGRETAGGLTGLADGQDIVIGNGDSFFAAPASENSLAGLYARHPDATLVAGCTDVGLWITKGMAELDKIIWLGRVSGLDVIDDAPESLAIGATASHSAAYPFLARIDPDLGELMRRFGSAQVRASGTVGGNIANGSPIGDLAPAFIALDSELELRQGKAVRTIPLESFFIAYRRQDRLPGEFLRRVTVRKLKENEVFRAYKVSKRFDEDISAAMGAFRFTLDGRRIAEARVAFGGMAAIPKRAAETEGALAGLSLDDPSSWGEALAAIGRDYQPLDDHRASAAYRATVARNLLFKALSETASGQTRATRIVGRREALAAAE
jgi:xanthine dehydrogenase small subunit